MQESPHVGLKRWDSEGVAQFGGHGQVAWTDYHIGLHRQIAHEIDDMEIPWDDADYRDYANFSALVKVY